MSGTLGGGLQRTVELQDGERVEYEDDAAWYATWLRRNGKLYLTNQRLIWAGARPLWPLRGQPILAMPLGDILATDVKVPLFGGVYRLLVRTRERTYSFSFLPTSLKEDVEEWWDMIEKARGSHGTPS